MKQAQLFSPIYTIIFIILITSVTLSYELIIEDWRIQAIVKNEVNNLENLLNLMNEFRDYEIVYNLSEVANLTISSEIIELSVEGFNESFQNHYFIEGCEFLNINSIHINKSKNEWVIN